MPLAIFQGAADELVPVSGVTRQVERLVELGYRHRYYVFPTYEHYSHPVVDEWLEGARYVHRFVRDPNPAHVTYVRDMPFERTVETGPSQTNPTQRAVVRLRPRLLDERAHAGRPRRRRRAASTAPPSGAPRRAIARSSPRPAARRRSGQAGPYAMTGLAWLADPLAVPDRPERASSSTSTGATRRAPRPRPHGPHHRRRPSPGTVTTEHPLELRLTGTWATRRPWSSSTGSR